MDKGVRIDKWLWAVRIYKTRSLASESCRTGKVLIGGETVKPSRIIKVDDIIAVKKPPITFTFKVTGIIEKRVSAKLATENLENMTPEEEMNRIITIKESAFYQRNKGTGRPTKKERRFLDKMGI